MFFKFHLLVVSIIIVVMYAVWQTMVNISNFEVKQEITPLVESPFEITISKATWGLNCLKEPKQSSHSQSNNAPSGRADDPFWKTSQNKPIIINENNVLSRVKALCDKRLICRIQPNSKALGPDPAPNCSKTLDVEYRCFNYDRPWYAQATKEPLVINCNRSTTVVQ